jgi:hypothetical protein
MITVEIIAPTIAIQLARTAHRQYRHTLAALIRAELSSLTYIRQVIRDIISKRENIPSAALAVARLGGVVAEELLPAAFVVEGKGASFETGCARVAGLARSDGLSLCEVWCEC